MEMKNRFIQKEKLHAIYKRKKIKKSVLVTIYSAIILIYYADSYYSSSTITNTAQQNFEYYNLISVREPCLSRAFYFTI